MTRGINGEVKMRTALEIEIFGADEPPAPSAPAPRALPTDDPLFDYLPAGRSADAAIEQAVTEHFASEILGMTPEQFRKAVSATDEPASAVLAKSARRAEEINQDFEARLETLFRKELNLALIPLRVADLESRAPLRKAAITRILRPLYQQFEKSFPAWEFEPGNEFAERFLALASSLEQFVTNAIISEA
jgi:hypothetical protein